MDHHRNQSAASQLARTGSTPKTFHTFIDYPDGISLPGIIIPQAVVHSAQSQRQQNVLFRNPDLTYSCGVSIPSALQHNVAGAISDLVHLTSPGVRICINWPGYDPWMVDITMPFDHDIPKGILLQKIAHCVQKCMQNLRDLPCSEPQWMVSKFSLDKIYIVELRSMGGPTWQPVLCCN